MALGWAQRGLARAEPNGPRHQALIWLRDAPAGQPEPGVEVEDRVATVTVEAVRGHARFV